MKAFTILLILVFSTAYAQNEENVPPGQLNVTSPRAKLRRSISHFVDQANRQIKACSTTDSEEYDFVGIYDKLSKMKNPSKCETEDASKKEVTKAYNEAFIKCVVTDSFKKKIRAIVDDHYFLAELSKKNGLKKAREIQKFYRKISK